MHVYHNNTMSVLLACVRKALMLICWTGFISHHFQVVRTTGFMKGLYGENEMKSENVKVSCAWYFFCTVINWYHMCLHLYRIHIHFLITSGPYFLGFVGHMGQSEGSCVCVILHAVSNTLWVREAVKVLELKSSGLELTPNQYCRGRC